MKLSFTTLGCPNWDLKTMVARAVEYGFNGVDFRGYLGEMNIYELPEFSTEVEETRAQLQKANLEVSCFSSSVRLFSQDVAESEKEIRQYARLCRLFNAKYIRVFGGKIGEVERGEAVKIVGENLMKLAESVRGHGVKLLIETHDDWTTCEDVRSIIEQADSDVVAVLWDTHHPYRMVGEEPETTWKALGSQIEYTHWKDSFQGRESHFHYCYMGEGDIPLKRIYNVLTKNHYTGWFTLEWEKKWHPEIEEPEKAFPQYVRYMRQLAEAGGE